VANVITRLTNIVLHNAVSDVLRAMVFNKVQTDSSTEFGSNPVLIDRIRIKSVVKPVWQPIGCLFTRYSWLSNRLCNQFDNQLYCANGVLVFNPSHSNYHIRFNITATEIQSRPKY